jgi:hypothetical protein
VTAPAGAIVSLYVDFMHPVDVGDIIETETGRRYEALHVRVQQRGKRIGRQHLRCIVRDGDAPIAPGTVIHRLRWYKRGRARR